MISCVIPSFHSCIHPMIFVAAMLYPMMKNDQVTIPAADLAQSHDFSNWMLIVDIPFPCRAFCIRSMIDDVHIYIYVYVHMYIYYLYMYISDIYIIYTYVHICILYICIYYIIWRFPKMVPPKPSISVGSFT